MKAPTTRLTLLQRLHDKRDDAAWREFVALYGPLVYRLGRRKGLPSDTADELAQRFCVRAARALPEFVYAPERGRFRSWVLRVALNEIRAMNRKEATDQRALEAYCQQGHAVKPEVDDKVREWWKAEESRRILNIALERLRAEAPPDKFGMFYLSGVDGVPVSEVASFYGKTAPQVSLVKYRMLQRLRAIAEEMTEQWHES